MEALSSLLDTIKFEDVEVTVNSVLRAADPSELSQEYNGIINCVDASGDLFICVHKDLIIRAESLCDALLTATQLFFVLNVEFPTGAKTLYNFIACLHHAGQLSTLPSSLCEMLWAMSCQYQF